MKAKQQYINVSLDSCNHLCSDIYQKKFMTKMYKVPLTKVYPILLCKISSNEWDKTITSDSDDECENLPNKILFKLKTYLSISQLSERLCPVNGESFMIQLQLLLWTFYGISLIYPHTKINTKKVNEQLNEILI